MDKRIRVFVHEYLVLFVLTFVIVSSGQRTHLRSCDCEYVDNGRCAYTLMLPLPANNAGESCPKQDTTTSHPDSGSGSMDELAAQIQDIHMKLDNIMMNISSLDTDRNDQMRMIAQIQSRLMEQNGTLHMLQADLQMLLHNMNNTGGDHGMDHDMGSNTTMDHDMGSNTTMDHDMGSNTTSDHDAESIETPTCCQTLNHTIHELRMDVEMAMHTLTNLTMHLNMTHETVSDNRMSISDLQQEIEAQKMDLAEMSTTIMTLTRDYFLCKLKGPLVSGDKVYVNDSAISASSTNNSATYVRIHNEGSAFMEGAWCPEDPDSQDPLPREWVQFDLGSVRAVFGVVTRGRSDYTQWVTSYQLEYANDDSDENNWKLYRDVIGEELTFEGNMDSNSTKTNMLWQPIYARFVRIVPLTARISNEQMGNRCMRADLVGCVDP